MNPLHHTVSPRLGGCLALALALGLTACAGMTQREKNTAIGAGVGGSVLTGGGTLGTLGGAAIGGVIGNQIDDKK